MYDEQASFGTQHSSIDLQIAVLRHLPTPIFVLSSSQTITYLNKAASKLLGHSHLTQSQNELIYSRDLDDLGIKLLDNTTWSNVLEELLAANIQASQTDNEAATCEVNIVISTETRVDFNTKFRGRLTAITADDRLAIHRVQAQVQNN